MKEAIYNLLKTYRLKSLIRHQVYGAIDNVVKEAKSLSALPGINIITNFDSGFSTTIFDEQGLTQQINYCANKTNISSYFSSLIAEIEAGGESYFYIDFIYNVEDNYYKWHTTLSIETDAETHESTIVIGEYTTDENSNVYTDSFAELGIIFRDILEHMSVAKICKS